MPLNGEKCRKNARDGPISRNTLLRTVVSRDLMCNNTCLQRRTAHCDRVGTYDSQRSNLRSIISGEQHGRIELWRASGCPVGKHPLNIMPIIYLDIYPR
jgi:hypothetical protein